MFLEGVVEAVGFGPGGFEFEAAAEDLDAEMVFLVDHDADGFVVTDGDAAGAFAGGVLLGDEVAFDEHLAVDFVGLFHVDVEGGAAGGGVGGTCGEAHESFAADFVEFGALEAVGFGHEGVVGDVAGEADAGGDDDFLLCAGAGEPFAGLICEIGEFHFFLKKARTVIAEIDYTPLTTRK